MLLQDSRRAARASAGGDLVLLADQDRSRWDRARIGEGKAPARAGGGVGPGRPYGLQAAIAAAHTEAPTAGATDWARIVALYDLLARASPRRWSSSTGRSPDR